VKTIYVIFEGRLIADPKISQLLGMVRMDSKMLLKHEFTLAVDKKMSQAQKQARNSKLVNQLLISKIFVNGGQADFVQNG
jgi:hypothetical protein